MDEQVLEINSLISKNLTEKEDWKYAYLKNRPLPPIQVNYQFSWSCPQYVVASLIGGYGMGCLFALFLNMNDNNPIDNTISYRTQSKVFFKSSRAKMHRQGKGFGVFGALLFSFQCPLESYRGSHDVLNGLIAGALTGIFLSVNRGAKIQGILGSAISTGLFMGLIDLVMES